LRARQAIPPKIAAVISQATSVLWSLPVEFIDPTSL